MAKALTKAPPSKRKLKVASAAKNGSLKRSKLDVFDIPLTLLDPSPDNPQEMDDATFDELCDGMRREGFDEPIQVIPLYDNETGKKNGRYMIISGHHRVKAAKAIGLTEAPSIIKPEMEDAARKIALVRRNQLRGNMNKKKFTDLFREVAPQIGAEAAKRLMGFTKEAAFQKLYDDATKSLPKEHRHVLEEAKEDVRSVDDLSSVLNGIFRKEGSKVQKGYMVFSYGGKDHHYFQIDKPLDKMLKQIEAKINEEGKAAADIFKELFERAGIATPSVETKKKVKVNAVKGKTKKS